MATVRRFCAVCLSAPTGCKYVIITNVGLKYLIAIHQKLIKSHRIDSDLIDFPYGEKEFIVFP